MWTCYSLGCVCLVVVLSVSVLWEHSPYLWEFLQSMWGLWECFFYGNILVKSVGISKIMWEYLWIFHKSVIHVFYLLKILCLSQILCVNLWKFFNLEGKSWIFSNMTFIFQNYFVIIASKTNKKERRCILIVKISL